MKKLKAISLILIGFMLVGCGTKSEQVAISTQKENANFMKNSSDNVKNTESTSIEKHIEEIVNNDSKEFDIDKKIDVNKNNIDETIIKEFNNLKDQVKKIINSDSVKNVKEKCKNVFIKIVDFIFYDGEIKGIKFDDLSDTAKQEILSIASEIDNLIMKKFPNYKENISEFTGEAYTKASELIKKGADNIKDFSKEKLGEENYNKLVEAKDNIKEVSKDVWQNTKEDISNIYNNSKQKVKDWYENFKNKKNS